jgi:hypothetical protein
MFIRVFFGKNFSKDEGYTQIFLGLITLTSSLTAELEQKYEIWVHSCH